MRMKKAAPGRPVDQQTQAYPQQSVTSTRFSPKIPGRSEIRKPKQHMQGWSTSLSDALTFLVLGLQRDDLPPCQQRRAWKLAERWLSEFVEARLERGAA